MALEEFLVKNLAQDIEASGKTRKDFSLTQYLANNKNLYGEAGSKKRRDAQKKFTELVRKSPEAYQNFLDKFGVIAGEGLKRELRTSKSVKSSKSSSDSDSDSLDSEEDESVKPAPKTPAKPPSKKPPSSKPISIEEITQQFQSLCRPPVPEVAFAPRTVTMSSTTSSAKTENSVVLNQVEVLSRLTMDGSENNPYIIIVDPDKPEANWGFEVSFVPQIEHRNFSRDIYHIRKVIGVSQEDEWIATIPTKKFPTLASRAVLVRGPSQDFWHQDAERYHQTPFCDQTKKVHETLQTNLEANKDRLFSFWLLVFPVGTEMENFVLSDDAVHVKKSTLDLVGSYSFVDDRNKTQEVELLGVDVHWRIAVRGGEMIRSPSAPSKNKQRFAQRKGK
jgi:hypothetical protein